MKIRLQFILRLIILIYFIVLYFILLYCTSSCILKTSGMNHHKITFKIFTQNQPFQRYQNFVMLPPNTKFSTNSPLCYPLLAAHFPSPYLCYTPQLKIDFSLYRGADKSLARQEGNKLQRQKILMFIYPIYDHNWRNISTIYIYRGADKSLARPGRKQATATEDFDFYISYL